MKNAIGIHSDWLRQCFSETLASFEADLSTAYFLTTYLPKKVL